jgi:hypothetical protein
MSLGITHQMIISKNEFLIVFILAERNTSITVTLEK